MKYDVASTNDESFLAIDFDSTLSNTASNLTFDPSMEAPPTSRSLGITVEGMNRLISEVPLFSSGIVFNVKVNTAEGIALVQNISDIHLVEVSNRRCQLIRHPRARCSYRSSMKSSFRVNGQGLLSCPCDAPLRTLFELVWQILPELIHYSNPADSFRRLSQASMWGWISARLHIMSWPPST